MVFQKGNKFWQIRAKHGRDKLFASPELLWEAACEYFEWAENNPLIEERPFAYQGDITMANVNLMRAMTMEQLCFFLNCNEAYFRQFREALKDKTDEMSFGFSTVIADIEAVIKSQKFQGAAAGLLNANIIARDLGLADKSDFDHKSSDGTMTPRTIVTTMTAEELKKALEK